MIGSFGGQDKTFTFGKIDVINYRVVGMTESYPMIDNLRVDCTIGE